jgi:hypothetical protein
MKHFLTTEWLPVIIAASTFLTSAAPQPANNAKETIIIDIFPSKLN